MNTPIQFHINANGIGLLVINRPEVRNALNWDAQQQFAAAVETAAASVTLRVLVVTGTGEHAFASGGDLKELHHHPDPDSGRRLHQTMSVALAGLTQLPVPVIAAVNGDAAGGGCEIITACDLRIAAPHARLRFAQINNALTTGWGGTRRLVQLLGQSRAMELLLTGRPLRAAEAMEYGLVHRLSPADQPVLNAAIAWAETLCSLSREALAAVKQLVYASATCSPVEGQSLEARLFTQLWSEADHLEALRAFAEKREPRFNQGDS